MILNSEDIIAQENSYRRNFINSLTGFKSCVLVGTVSSNGETNLAIFSQVIHVGANPPYLGILFRPHVIPRHTFENILSTKIFTVNLIPQGLEHLAHHSSARWRDSEFDSLSLEPEWFDDIKVPFVKESKIKLFCHFQERLDVQSNGTHLIVGSIQRVIVSDELVGHDGFIDQEKARTVTSLGLDGYYKAQKIARFEYAKPGREPEIKKD